jgi:hypothetical protein
LDDTKSNGDQSIGPNFYNKVFNQIEDIIGPSLNAETFENSQSEEESSSDDKIDQLWAQTHNTQELKYSQKLG